MPQHPARTGIVCLEIAGDTDKIRRMHINWVIVPPLRKASINANIHRYSIDMMYGRHDMAIQLSHRYFEEQLADKKG